MKEIERKFILKELPDSMGEEPVAVLQGYITEPDDSVEVRLRQKGSTYILTCKTGQGMTREEQESEIGEDLFQQFWPLTVGRRVCKVRYKVALPNALMAEIDIFEDSLAGLKLCEVEFPDEASALAFVPPAWFGREVTEDPAYKNKQLAIHGLAEK
ncbi:CYTH domain-containing protein [Pontiellaceae bacterium B1224]|nr:CYTH domain-containing protein [Pontiellaceae bacterium B1224]